MNTSLVRSLPVKFVGALIALIGAGIALYLMGVFTMYATAWVVQFVEWIFGCLDKQWGSVLNELRVVLTRRHILAGYCAAFIKSTLCHPRPGSSKKSI